MSPNAAHERLVKACLDATNLDGFVMLRHDTQTLPMQWVTRDGKTHRAYRKLGSKGTPDLMGYRKRDARFTVVEVKKKPDTLTDAQARFMGQVVKDGGLAYVAHDTIDGLLRWIRENR